MGIRQLPEEVINKIAAGEVVERPASVLKELIENSLDAKAQKIEIFIEKGGKRLIKVRDDGTGIPPEDMLIAVKRWTTSKIFSADDLYSLESYGFRGEALSSISSVSKFKLISRTINNPLGSELYIEGSKLQYFRETGTNLGTTVEVKDLFFNVPARQKFLKTEKTELIHILDVFAKYAFLHTDKYFTIHIDGKSLYEFYPSTLKERLNLVLDKYLLDNIIHIDFEGQIGSVKGYISMTNQSTKKKYLYINNRPVKNNIIQNTLKELIGDSFYIIFIDLPSYFVDFNVHPSKQEVKFIKESSVVKLMKTALEENLNQFSKSSISYQINDNFNQYSLKQSKATYGEPKFEVIGQVEDTFLIAYYNGEIYFIDQHIAHERIFYELLLNEYKSKGKIHTQSLITPSILKLPPDDIQKLEILKPNLEKLGYKIDIKENTVVIKGIPFNLSISSAENALMDILDTQNLHISIEEMASTISCKMSIKAGDKLDKQKAYGLIENWLKTNNPNLCPHGRPIYYKISLEEIKKAVGRK